MIRLSRSAGLVIAVAALLLPTACGSDQPAENEAPLETKSKAEVETVARSEADSIATLAGGKLEDWKSNTTACEGRNGDIADDGRWNLAGFAHVTLAADKHVPALRAVHDTWKAQNWEISDYRTLSDGVRGTLAGRDPQSGINVSLTSSNPPVQIAVIVGSPCYQPAQGENPADG